MYDSSEDNHVLVRDILHASSVIPARYEQVPIRRTHGRYRKKQMKHGYYSQLLESNLNHILTTKHLSITVGW